MLHPLVNPLRHDSSGRDRDRLLARSGEPLRNDVRVHELGDFEVPAEQVGSDGGFPRAVRPAEDDQIRSVRAHARRA
jgi:hypothetical protein